MLMVCHWAQKWAHDRALHSLWKRDMYMVWPITIPGTTNSIDGRKVILQCPLTIPENADHVEGP